MVSQEPFIHSFNFGQTRVKKNQEESHLIKVEKDSAEGSKRHSATKDGPTGAVVRALPSCDVVQRLLTSLATPV